MDYCTVFCVKSAIIICFIHYDFSISAAFGRNVAVNVVSKKIIFMHASRSSFTASVCCGNVPDTLTLELNWWTNSLSITLKSKYLLTPWCRVLLEKLTGLQLVKKFPAFHETRRFITALTSLRHLSLSWASPIQSIYPYPTSWRSILILSTHLGLGLASGLLPSGFPTKTL